MSQNPLYHDIILEHFEFPRHKGACECPDASSRGANAMCGDDLLISVRLDSEAEALDEVCWEGRACAIGEASASMMSEAVSGQPKGEARRWVRTVKGLVTGRDARSTPIWSWATWRPWRESGSTRCGSSAPCWPGRPWTRPSTWRSRSAPPMAPSRPAELALPYL